MQVSDQKTHTEQRITSGRIHNKNHSWRRRKMITRAVAVAIAIMFTLTCTGMMKSTDIAAEESAVEDSVNTNSKILISEIQIPKI